MAEYEIALKLMGLYGRLRRARDPQARQALKGRIDHLVSQLGRERYLREVALPPHAGKPNPS